jgi:predicted GIY-YIG superfamily endonuclease
MYYVYILKCKDGNIYTGCTNDLKDRVKRHIKGYVTATKERRPVNLINYIAFKNKYKAYEFEIYLKSGSGRAFIKKHFSNM